jgi:threonine/homoserine/homoserine lactone efflux protein
MHEVLRVVLYGLVAAASPAMLLASLALLAAPRARFNGSIFAIGVLLGQALAFAVVYLAGSTASPRPHTDAMSYVELVVGVGLLVFAWHSRRSRPKPDSARSLKPRAGRLNIERLTHIKGPTLFGVALLMGVGVKRLAITIVAAAVVALSGQDAATDVFLGVVYVVIATSVVWIPVAIYLIFGARSDEFVAKARRWISTHTRELAFYSALALGVLFIGDAIVRLTTGFSL